ncbi:MAG: MogA/MoaB family molybdenum cofactor biosynthesis protein [Anaerovoracaceae bacterium]|jgi:molybdopterin adenylyltransferase
MKSKEKKKAAVITLSDKGSRGERVDTAGPACIKILEDSGWQVIYSNMISDDFQGITEELKKCADSMGVTLVVTTGGTGFSQRDVAPEATLSVCDREVRGIPEAMRAESLKITPMGMLSRAAAGLRGATLIVNVPGSEKAARECLAAVIGPIGHGVEVLLGTSTDCAKIHMERK